MIKPSMLYSVRGLTSPWNLLMIPVGVRMIPVGVCMIPVGVCMIPVGVRMIPVGVCIAVKNHCSGPGLLKLFCSATHFEKVSSKRLFSWIGQILMMGVSVPLQISRCISAHSQIMRMHTICREE